MPHLANPVEPSIGHEHRVDSVRGLGLFQRSTRDSAALLRCVEGGRGDPHPVLGEHSADRGDPETVTVKVDVLDDHRSRRSTSAAAKNAAAVLRIRWLCAIRNSLAGELSAPHRDRRPLILHRLRQRRRPARPSSVASPGSRPTVDRRASVRRAWCHRARRPAPDTSSPHAGGSPRRTSSVQPYRHSPGEITVSTRPRTVQVVVGNSGPTVARNIRVLFDPPLPTGQQHSDKAEKVQSTLSNGLHSLTPNRVLRWTLGVGYDLLSSDESQLRSVRIDAEGPHGPLPTLEMGIDISEWRHARDAPDGSLHHVRGAIKDLTKAVISVDKSLKRNQGRARSA